MFTRQHSASLLGRMMHEDSEVSSTSKVEIEEEETAKPKTPRLGINDDLDNESVGDLCQLVMEEITANPIQGTKAERLTIVQGHLNLLLNVMQKYESKMSPVIKLHARDP